MATPNSKVQPKQKSPLDRLKEWVDPTSTAGKLKNQKKKMDEAIRKSGGY